ncbi:Crp/Fnr family transcriptional regulator [Candidatus Omnitrophota bacterium]
MDSSFRSGSDRRSRDEEVENNKRTGLDRRTIINRIDHYSGILEKIPFFKKLSIDQLKKILSLSTYKALQANKALCTEGDKSVEIYILIKGQLNVTFPDGRVITRINPPGVVGEMGFFTGESRSASVITGKESLILTLKKFEMTRLFKQDPELSRVIMLNIISDLSSKLRHINDMFEKLNTLHILE